ncbi:MAG TPA: PIN domain-containing protein [Mycobacteriales bacterium]|nr:PIN domain-containing protein [Mycobacteriales bacterium]
MSAFLDTNIIIRHLTGDPPKMARQATAFLADADELLLTDLIVAETVYVLESFYDVPREKVADLLRAVIAFPPISVVNEVLLLRALEVYEVHRLDFAEAYLVAFAEVSGVGAVASFDKAISQVPTVHHVIPGRAS